MTDLIIYVFKSTKIRLFKNKNSVFFIDTNIR